MSQQCSLPTHLRPFEGLLSCDTFLRLLFRKTTTRCLAKSSAKKLRDLLHAGHLIDVERAALVAVAALQAVLRVARKTEVVLCCHGVAILG